MNDEKRLVRVRVSTHLLLQALGFPHDTEILGCSGHDAHPWFGGTIELCVSHPSLPRLDPGENVPLVVPTFTRNEDYKPGKFLTMDWNLPGKGEQVPGSETGGDRDETEI